MRLFKVSSDTKELTGIVYVLASNRSEAEQTVIQEYFYTYNDDMLSDAYEIEEITEPGIVCETDLDETFAEKYSRIRMK